MEDDRLEPAGDMEDGRMEQGLEVISQIKQVRKELHITQEAPAGRAGTKIQQIRLTGTCGNKKIQ